MSPIVPKASNAKYNLPPAGGLNVTCAAALYIGTQPPPEGGKSAAASANDDPARPRPTCGLVFQFGPEDAADGPGFIATWFTFSWHRQAKLRAWVGAWLGRDLAEAPDLTELLGKGCRLNIVHQTSAAGRTYAKVTSFSGLRKGESHPKLAHPPFSWAIGDPLDLLEAAAEPLGWLPMHFGLPLVEAVRRAAEFNRLYGAPVPAAAPGNGTATTGDDPF